MLSVLRFTDFDYPFWYLQTRLKYKYIRKTVSARTNQLFYNISTIYCNRENKQHFPNREIYEPRKLRGLKHDLMTGGFNGQDIRIPFGVQPLQVIHVSSYEFHTHTQKLSNRNALIIRSNILVRARSSISDSTCLVSRFASCELLFCCIFLNKH